MEKTVRNRVRLLLIAVLILAGGIAGKLVYLQVYCCDKLRARALVQHRREITVPATRGSILDRNGHDLALSLRTESAPGSLPAENTPGVACSLPDSANAPPCRLSTAPLNVTTTFLVHGYALPHSASMSESSK